MHEFLWEIWVGRNNMHHRMTMDLNESPTVVFQRIIQELQGTDKAIQTTMMNPNTGQEEKVNWEFSCRVKGEEWSLKDGSSFTQQGVVEGAMLVVRAKTIRANTIYVDGIDGLDDEQMAAARSKTPLIVGALIILAILGSIGYYMFVIRPQEQKLEPYRVKIGTKPDDTKAEFLLVFKTKEKGPKGKALKWPDGSFKMLTQTRRLSVELAKGRLIPVAKKSMIAYALLEAKGKQTWMKGASFDAWSRAKIIDKCKGRKCYTHAVQKQFFSAKVKATLTACTDDKSCGAGNVCKGGFCAKSCKADAVCGGDGVCQDGYCMARLEPFAAAALMKEGFFPTELKKFVAPPKPRGPVAVPTHKPKAVTVTYPKRWRALKVVFDAMHGGSDKGATGVSDKTAKDYNLAMAQAFTAYFNKNKARKKKVKAYYTRLKDGNYAVNSRRRTLRRKNLLVQLNVLNGLEENKKTNQKSKDKKFEYNDTIAGFSLVVQGIRKVRGRRAKRRELGRAGASVKFAQCISDSLKKAGFRMKPTKGADKLSKAGIQVANDNSLLNTSTVGVRINLGYISHQKEATLLLKPETHTALASAIEDAIVCLRKK